MSHLQLIDAQCRVEQAQATLSVWLRQRLQRSGQQLICALMTLLEDVPEAIKVADEELADCVMRTHREKRQ
jgi:hypothetical protein